MSEPVLLRIEGEVERPQSLTTTDFASLDERHQIRDVSRIDPKRRGDAVTLAGLLELAGARPTAKYLTLHAEADDFHASIPLEAVRERGFVIYQVDGSPLPVSAGGPARFYIRDFAACQIDEVDECANVKFLDRMELTAERGHDTRPTDEDEHAALHESGS